MAALALVSVSCAKRGEQSDVNGEGKAPITKPQITIEGGRLTPEGLWAMGRIGSVKSEVRILGTESEQGVVLLRPTEPVRNGDKVF